MKNRKIQITGSAGFIGCHKSDIDYGLHSTLTWEPKKTPVKLIYNGEER